MSCPPFSASSASSSLANAPVEAEQAWPQSSGEEELQLQLALAMSKEEAEQPPAVADEDLQLQLALSLSKEEHDKEERIRRGDDLRLQMAIEESKKETVPAKEESSLMDLTDVFTAPPPADPWGVQPAPADPWGGSTTVVPAARTDLWGPPAAGAAPTGDPWGTSAAPPAPPSDPWGAPPAASADPWKAEGQVSTRLDEAFFYAAFSPRRKDIVIPRIPPGLYNPGVSLPLVFNGEVLYGLS
ncbi:hypothetical protein Chor_009459 [Crotalus horridus]